MKIAVTGGIGSGKSEVMKILGQSFKTASADKINADLLANVYYIEEIAKNFPSVVKDGIIDKTALRNEIFSNGEKRELLNSIAHPKIRAEIDKLDDNTIVEVPLLFESGMQDLFDVIIVVTSKRAIRVERIMTRGLDRDTAEKIIDTQMPDEYKIANADYVIKNNDDINTLENNVKLVFDKIKNASK